jgi:hypothetical protein
MNKESLLTKETLDLLHNDDHFLQTNRHLMLASLKQRIFHHVFLLQKRYNGKIFFAY